MFGSGVIITGGKRRSDVNATYAPDPSPRHVQLWLHESLSGVFRGSLEAYSPGACSQVSGRSDILQSGLGTPELTTFCTDKPLASLLRALSTIPNLYLMETGPFPHKRHPSSRPMITS